MRDDDLARRLLMIERRIASIEGGACRTNREMWGTGMDTPEPAMGAATDTVTRGGAQKIVPILGVPIEDCPRLVYDYDERAFGFFTDATLETSAGLITRSSQSAGSGIMHRGDGRDTITVYGTVTGTSFTLRGASGHYQFRTGSVVLALRRGLLVASATVGSLDAGCSFYMAADGYTLTFPVSPGEAPIFIMGVTV